MGVGVGALALVVVSVLWGRHVQSEKPEVKLGAAPLVGLWDWRPGLGLVAPVVLAAATVIAFHRWGRRLAWGWFMLTSAVTAGVFTLLVAASDGWSRVLDPVVDPTEYWHNLRILPPAGEMLQRYHDPEFLSFFSVHVRGHPPGFLLLLKAMDTVGLGAPWAVGALSYLGAAGVVAAVLVTLRAVADEAASRVVAPFLVLAPYVVWMGTSADAFYAAVAAWSVAFAVLAVRERRVARRRLLAASAGLAFGAALFLTYGTLIFGLIPVAVVLLAGNVSWRRRLGVLATAGAAMVAVVAVVGIFGFWWWDGAAATKELYWKGTAKFRPAVYFLVGNLGATVIALGPAVVAGLAWVRDRRVWVLVGSALICIAVADLSQHSKGEVERIWVLFFPWVVPATVVLGRRSARAQNGWLVAHAATALVLQAWLVSKW